MIDKEKKVDSVPLQEAISRRLSRACVARARWIWKHSPESWHASRLGTIYARKLDSAVRKYSERKQYFATFFFRNRPELELLQCLSDDKDQGAQLNLCILACSKGAEVYSMVWAIRSRRPDLDLRVTAIDVSPEILEFAANGVYSLDRSDALTPLDENASRRKNSLGWNTSRDQNASMFERMSQEEMESIFLLDDPVATVRPWLRDGISWLCADAADPDLRTKVGPQDIVVANRFLCHMQPSIARSCLEHIGRLVAPGGYLFVSGVDLDVRAGVAKVLGWEPVSALIREMHDGDNSIRRGWPLEYWGLEPFDDKRPDWGMRYASVFRIGQADRQPGNPLVAVASAS